MKNLIMMYEKIILENNSDKIKWFTRSLMNIIIKKDDEKTRLLNIIEELNKENNTMKDIIKNQNKASKHSRLSA